MILSACITSRLPGLRPKPIPGMTGKPQVTLATSGPGATNLITSIGSCYFDSTPTLFITGQVNLDEMSLDSAVRQVGFQETNIVTMVKPITKYAKLLKDPAAVADEIDKAICIAQEGRPGPVLLDIPMNVQRAEIPDQQIPDAEMPYSDSACGDIDSFAKALDEALSASSRPLILAGGGLRTAGVVEAFQTLLDKVSVPVVQSLLGLDSLEGDHPLRVGFIGTYGNRWANYALAKSDLLIVLGSRLDVRQLGKMKDKFINSRKVFRVDCDHAELQTLGASSTLLQLHSDLKPAIEYLVNTLTPYSAHTKMAGSN